MIETRRAVSFRSEAPRTKASRAVAVASPDRPEEPSVLRERGPRIELEDESRLAVGGAPPHADG
jgi:hypothetical protein